MFRRAVHSYQWDFLYLLGPKKRGNSQPEAFLHQELNMLVNIFFKRLVHIFHSYDSYEILMKAEV